MENGWCAGMSARFCKALTSGLSQELLDCVILAVRKRRDQVCLGTGRGEAIHEASPSRVWGSLCFFLSCVSYFFKDSYWAAERNCLGLVSLKLGKSLWGDPVSMHWVTHPTRTPGLPLGFGHFGCLLYGERLMGRLSFSFSGCRREKMGNK